MSYLLDKAAKPAPWGLSPDDIFAESSKGALKWNKIDTGGKSALVDTQGRPILLVTFQVYAVSLEDDQILLWFVQHQSDKPGEVRDGVINLCLLKISELLPIENMDAAFLKMEQEQGHSAIHYSGTEVAFFTLSTKIGPGLSQVNFPEPLKNLEEILVVADDNSSGKVSNYYDKSCCSIYALNPSLNTVEVYPQDWFADPGFDFMYQWIALVARDPSTKRIVGHAVRIGKFVLDDTCRQLDAESKRRFEMDGQYAGVADK